MWDGKEAGMGKIYVSIKIEGEFEKYVEFSECMNGKIGIRIEPIEEGGLDFGECGQYLEVQKADFKNFLTMVSGWFDGE